MPEEVEVIGFDDTEDARFASPALSSVAVGTAQIAEHAVTLLEQRGASRNGRGAGVALPYEVELRRSTDPAAPRCDRPWRTCVRACDLREWRNSWWSQRVAAQVKTIVYSSTGPSDVLDLVDRDVPTPGPGEVRVRVAVSGVNPTDWKARSGGNGDLAFAEVTPNQDGAGTVDALGDGVTGFAVGDRVWTYMAAASRPTGTAAEFTVLPADRVVALPEGTSFDVGASLGVPAITAHRALTVHEEGPSRLAPGAFEGRTVLVAGGAGAVGHAAIQLARWAGATVITTVSGPEKAALATAAGAHHVVNYREPGAAERIREIAPDGVHTIVEVNLGANAELDLAVLAPRGVIAAYADDGGPTVTIPVRPSMVGNVRFQFVLLYTIGRPALEAAAQDVSAALRDDALPVGAEHGLPLHRYALAQTAAAHDAVEGSALGKVLIDVN